VAIFPLFLRVFVTLWLLYVKILPGDRRMIEGLSRFFSGDLGLNGVIIGGMMVVLGIIILIMINLLSKEKKNKEN
jgi:hypothetical protein